MKRSRINSLVYCLFAGLCAPLLGQCGGATDPGVQVGTETGNPPRIEERKLFLIESARGVAIVAEAGAVTPASGTVLITNRSTGASQQGSVRNDGSFDVVLPGSLQDVYDVSISSGGRSTSVQVNAPAGSGDVIESLSCQTLENTLSPRLADSFASAQTGCSSDIDCGLVYWNVGCFDGCGASIVAQTDAAAAQARAEQTTAALCSELDARCVRTPAPDCLLDDLGMPACVEGSCQGLDLARLSCDDLPARAGQQMSDAVGRASLACQVDADCTFFSASVSCRADCGSNYAVAGAAVQALEAERARVEQVLCQAYADRPCPPPIPLPCVPPVGMSGIQSLRCVNQQCQVELVPYR
jgi:hypothetical protein